MGVTRPTHRPHLEGEESYRRRRRHRTGLGGGDSSDTSPPLRGGRDATEGGDTGRGWVGVTRPTHRPHLEGEETLQKEETQDGAGWG